MKKDNIASLAFDILCFAGHAVMYVAYLHMAHTFQLFTLCLLKSLNVFYLLELHCPARMPCPKPVRGSDILMF